jgi:HAD superfamily hydrolase (TIGR01549 family)
MDDIKYILFDWGGTLCNVNREYDTFHQCARAGHQTALRHGYPIRDGDENYLADQFITEHGQASIQDDHPEIRLDPIVRQWLSRLVDRDHPPEIINAVCDAFWAEWVGCLDEIPRSRETLVQLKCRGYRLGIVSNCATPENFCHAELDRLGFRCALDVFSFSSQLGRRKPHPDIYAHALNQIGHSVPHEVLFVGDSPINDVVAPAQLGMKTALLPDHAGHWPPHHYARARPDLNISTVADLLDCLPTI